MNLKVKMRRPAGFPLYVPISPSSFLGQRFTQGVPLIRIGGLEIQKPPGGGSVSTWLEAYWSGTTLLLKRINYTLDS